MSSIFKVSPPQEGIKRRLLLALSLGAFLLISSIALILTDPMWAIAKYKFRLANGSILHELLSSEMEGGRFAVYLFNITNPDRFLSGEDPYLKLDEVGPFTYLEYRTHSELQFDREAGVMRYTPRMRSVFVPEESIGNPEDIFLTMPNIPMLSATTMIRSSPVFIRNIYNIVARQYGSQPIVKLAASKYLWGYKDPVLTFANSLVPGLIYFNTTGIMDRLYDKNVHYRMELGTNDDDKFKIKRIHKYTRLHPESEVFDESILTFNDTYEGMAYPPMIGKNTPINIFRLGICKSFEMEYHGNKTSEYGPNAFVYKFNEKMFENNLCDVKGACPKGVMDLSACFYGLPMGLSKGHLLDADPKLFDRIKGLKPDPEKHSSHLVIEPKIGLTLETSWSLQANIFVGDITYNAEAKMFSNMILPIAHFKINCLQVTECISGRLIIITAIAGVTILAAALVTMALDPIQLLINYNTRVTNNSFMFNMFQKEVEGAHLSLYVFNVTNAQEFMSGEDHSLNVQEVGPFTYAEIRQNIDIDLDEEAGELEFTPNMKLRFVPEQSVARPEDVIVTVPNLALLSVASLVSSLPFFIRNTFKLLFSTLNCKSITTIDVYSFLWGYSDPLISQAYNIVPGIVYFDKFGIMDRLYDNKTIYRMRVGIRDEDRFSIKTLKKYMKSDNWMNERALESYKYKNTYEGAAYPPGLNVETPINIYRLGVCRELNLEFHGTKNMEYGGDAWIYRISNETFNRDCAAGVCGMMDLSSCTYGIPITMSRTHFLETDPKIYERIKGINPDPSKHDSHFLLEPNIGISLSTSLSLQMNMKLGDLRFSDKTEMFSDLVLPVAYIKVVQQDVFDALNGILRTIHITAPITLISIEVTMFLIAVAILAYSGLLLYRRSKCKAKKKAYAKLNLRQNLPLIQCQVTKT